MGHLQLSRTRIVPERWQDITTEENDAQSAAIYDVIGRHGGDVKVVAFCPSDTTLLSVIEYPDDLAARKSVAGILALRTLEFVSVDALWDIGEWVTIAREAAEST